MPDEQKAQLGGSDQAPSASQPLQRPSVPLYTEEQVKQIVAASMFNNPRVLDMFERVTKMGETFVNGMVHEKKLLAWSKPVILVLLLFAVILLKWMKAFDGDVALLIGTIAGYFFGKSKATE